VVKIKAGGDFIQQKYFPFLNQTAAYDHPDGYLHRGKEGPGQNIGKEEEDSPRIGGQGNKPAISLTDNKNVVNEE
jgi:hypothetical protein